MAVANDSADWLGAYEDKKTCGRDTLMDVGLSTMRSLFWMFMLNRDYQTEKNQPTKQNDLTSWQLEFWNSGCIKTAAKKKKKKTAAKVSRGGDYAWTQPGFQLTGAVLGLTLQKV